MVIEHRWMHAETICYLLHQLDPRLKRRALSATPSVSATNDPATRFIAIEAGTTQLGQPNGEFGWDNEFPAHVQAVPAFEISKHKVTNGEYLRFVEQGGAAPLFWHLRDGAWRLRRMFDEVPLPLDAPVYATHEQARSFAHWAGARLTHRSGMAPRCLSGRRSGVSMGQYRSQRCARQLRFRSLGSRTGEFKSRRRQPIRRVADDRQWMGVDVDPVQRL